MNQPRSRVLARNTLLNLAGRVIPLVVGVAAVPFIIHAFGETRFGILSIAWVLLAYLNVFDLGMGPAVSRFVALDLGAGRRDRVRELAGTAASLQLLFGVAGAVVLALLTPVLVDHVLDVPSSLAAETRSTFYVVALTLPFVFVAGTARGLLEAAQRFDLSNLVGVPLSLSTLLLPLLAAFLGWGMVGVAVLWLVARAVAVVAFAILAAHQFPELRSGPRFSRHEVGELARFGGWVSASVFAIPLVLYTDRFFIGALVSVAALAVYVPPMEFVTRFEIVPISYIQALFPIASGITHEREAEVRSLFARSFKLILLVTAPVLVGLFIFAPDFLRLWLGPELAAQGTTVFRILIAGELIGILAPLPGGLLQARGYPEAVGKLHLALVPFNFLLVWGLVATWGLKGAAMSFALRSVVDAVALLVLAGRRVDLPAAALLRGIRFERAIGALVMLSFGLWAASALGSAAPQVLVALACGAVFAAATWKLVLDDDDRRVLQATLPRGSA